MAATINHASALYAGRVFHMVRENITLDNGTTVDIDTIRHPGAAAIVPLTERGSVILIRQYRHSVGGYIWEIPAGTLKQGEDPLVCAGRELTEETGFSAGSLVKVGEITPVPGYSDERIHLFLAEGLAPATQNLDSDEVLDVHEVPMNRVWDMIDRGDIQDAKSICGLFMARRRMDRAAVQ